MIRATAAIKFLTGFYDPLGAGNSYGEAYKLGCNAIALHGIPENLTPVIKVNPFQAFSLPIESMTKEKEKNIQPRNFGGISQSMNSSHGVIQQANQSDNNQSTMNITVTASNEKSLTEGRPRYIPGLVFIFSKISKTPFILLLS